MSKTALATLLMMLFFGFAAAQGTFPARPSADDFCFGYAICE